MLKYYVIECVGVIIGGVFDNFGIGGEIEMMEKQVEYFLCIGYIFLDLLKKVVKVKFEGQVELLEV